MGRGTYCKAVVGILAVLFLGGCGSPGPQAEFDKALVDAEVSTLELRIAQDIAGHPRGRSVSDLPQATRLYIKATRKLDGKAAKRHLADTATQVQDSCASCAAALDRERETR